MTVESIIHILSIVLPFANETAIVLTNSHIVKRLYVSECHHPSRRELVRKIAIDLLAYLGIMLFIGKNTLLYGYVTGIVTGVVLIFLSIIIPNLFLHHAIEVVARCLHHTTPYSKAAVGIGLIVLLVLFTNYCESVIQPLTTAIKIDPTNEKV